MKKLLSVMLSLALISALAAPVLAEARADVSGGEGLALWQLARCGEGSTFDDYLAMENLTREEYAAMERWAEGYVSVNSEAASAFDADAWFMKTLAYPPGNPNSKANWFAAQRPGYLEADFQKEMRYLWLTESYDAERARGGDQDLAARYPSEFAAFDADAWFAGYYGGILGVSKARYMETEGLTGEGDFRAALFAEWAVGPLSRFNGLVVTVDGTPIQFQAVRTDAWEVAEPVVRDGRILVPLRTVAQAMNCAVAYDGAARTAICTKGDVTVTFTLDSTAYSVVSPNAITTLSLAVPAAARDGRTYVPLRALGEALGYTVTWSAPFQTAALTAG